MRKETQFFASDVRLYIPQSIKQALKLLGELRQTRLIAGGTDLLVDLKQGLEKARNLISLHKIQELKKMEIERDRIRIGSMVTAQMLISHSLINRYLPALADAARSMASYQIRTMATIGGNISSAVPSADLPPPLIAAEATLELRCMDSEREVSLSSFFSGPRKTICGEKEMLTFIRVPLSPPQTGMSFQKFALREANALAVASVACCLILKGEKITKASIVLGSVAPTPVLASKASESLIGRRPSEKLFRQAALKAKEESKPISDIRGSIWHRKELIEVLTRRALAEARKRAQKESVKGK